jgi:3-dehydroshikimate dehydratase
MKFSLCSISFRHQLVAYDELVRFARDARLDGIELWGAHADCQYEKEMSQPAAALAGSAMRRLVPVTMISDYLDISTEAAFAGTLEKLDRLIRLADWFGTRHIRTFAGSTASAVLPQAERSAYVDRLRTLCDRCQAHDKQLLVETHPHTLADTLHSTLALLAEVGSDRLKLNFDALHVWEYGEDLICCLHVLEPWIEHCHLKNMLSPSHAAVFEPSNVYSSTGSREGMVPLHAGIIDYAAFLEHASRLDCYASIEWFGPQPFQVLSQEAEWLLATRIVGNY